MLYVVFEPNLSMVKNYFKNSCRMRTQIVIKIDTICPGHTPILSTKFHPNSSTSFCFFVLNCLAQSFNDEESLKNIIMSGSGHGSSPKLNHFFHVTHQAWPPCVIRIRRHLFEISWTQTNRETDRKGWKHNLLHLRWWRKQEDDVVASTILAEYIKYIWT